MTSPPTSPSRRSRRIVVVTIAVLVLGLGWWFWPRGIDARFIGNWTAKSEVEPGIATMQLGANGRTAMNERVLGASGNLQTYGKSRRWRVQGDELVLMPSFGTGPFGVYREIKYRLKGMLNGNPITDLRYRIVEISRNTLRIQQISSPDAAVGAPIEEFSR